MPTGGPPFYGRWPVASVYEARLDNTWASATPEWAVSWSPVPSGSPFTTGLYSGVDFTASSTVTITGGGKDVEYVVLAGGGAGGSGPGNTAGGGGAGGYRTGTLPAIAAGPYTVTVGAGGAGQPATTVSVGNNGNASVFGPISSTGGGGGGKSQNTGFPATQVAGSPGGSGGGGGGTNSPDGPSPAGTGVPGQGNPGGTGTNYLGSVLSGGGGGGAGGAGSPGGPPSSGSGGPGVTVSTTGTPFPAGVGGSTTNIIYPPVNGTANQGGGGPISYTPGSFASGSGGSGRVIIRWLT